MYDYFLSYYRSVIKDQVLQSKQMGRRENKSMNCEGRVPFDLLLVRFVLWHFGISFIVFPLHLNSPHCDTIRRVLFYTMFQFIKHGKDFD
jgi:hypothetical protein